MEPKTPNESFSIISNIMLPEQTNPSGNVHGGEIMKLMDTCGGLAAMRHSKRDVVTVKVDKLIFRVPIKVGQLVICAAKPTFTGRSSMEVKVIVKSEDVRSDSPQTVALTALFTFVALDDNGKPCEVPPLKPETEEEIKDFESGRKRYLKN